MEDLLKSTPRKEGVFFYTNQNNNNNDVIVREANKRKTKRKQQNNGNLKAMKMLQVSLDQKPYSQQTIT